MLIMVVVKLIGKVLWYLLSLKMFTSFLAL